ncbi:phosphinothricin acetyltransferase [Pseudomonas duriflava]|uniref:Phosphinothricin acetyltransferase n=2 Tax=Pseudomonas duriflava TaxID=459528 RepID=A0A562Q6H0_9PSED|nr:phosphinothricin acetyltransferase [Pseudomonas duriflava]
MPLIRDALETDIPAIQTIYAHHVLYGTATFEEAVPNVVEMQRRYATIRQAGLPYLVAEVDGHVRGYSYAGFYHPRSAYRFSLEDTIYLEDGWQGRGLGKSLLMTLLERCEAGGWRQMVSLIGGSDNAGSIGLHISLGFRHVGVLEQVGLKFGRWHDVVLMQKSLGKGSTDIP